MKGTKRPFLKLLVIPSKASIMSRPGAPSLSLTRQHGPSGQVIMKPTMNRCPKHMNIAAIGIWTPSPTSRSRMRNLLLHNTFVSIKCTVMEISLVRIIANLCGNCSSCAESVYDRVKNTCIGDSVIYFFNVYL
ncbi:unnamed protein product [Musa textilis]